MEGWKKDKLGNLLELAYGKSLPKNKRVDGNIPVHGSNGIVGFHNVAIVNEPGIIVGRKGSAGKVHISKVPFCPIDTTFYITQQYSKLDLEYLYYALNFLDLKRILGDVGVPGLNREMAYFEELFYPPDKAEQRKIAHVLNTVQKAIEQQDKLIRTTTELKKALMQKLFTEGTRGEPQKETEIGLVPESWEVVELGDICERVSINVKPNKDGNTPYVGLEHIIPSRLRLYNWGYENEIVSSKSKFKKGEILYGKLRPYLDKTVIAPFEGICSTDILVFSGKKEIENEYLIHFFHTEKLVGYANSTTTGVQHPRTSWNSLKRLEIALPDKDERTEITKSLNSLEDKVEFLNKKKQTLTALFKTLLHELMTGKRRVHELEFEKIEDFNTL
ncbi:MAG: restriction endonuclease subunit S [Methanosarcinales archaeon]|nr:restriction endonuclease subunit S [Methanosarcinales archaeon]